MRKSLLVAFFTAMLIGGFALATTLNFCTVQASTPAMGIIDSDTIWTKANSPYTLTGAVGVISGVTLKIEAGVTVNLGNNYIQVNGTLNAKGSITDPIYFNGGRDPAISFVRPISDLNEQDTSGSIIENAILNSSDITIINSSPKISNNTLLCRVSLFNSSSLILNNYFLKGDNFGLVAYDSNATISGNAFKGIYQAVYVGSSQSFSTPLIERNLITENQYGILMPTSVTFSPTIRNNTIANNTDGIGIWNGGNALPIIIYNNIYGNTEYNFRLTDIKNNIDATQNWWGTTDTQTISQTIYDYKNDFNLGNITFVPFLTEPNPQAMPDPNMLTQLPTPSPTPNSTSTPTPSPIPVPGQSFFFVESNSTVTELFFNSTSSVLSFTVNGTSGTMGYVKVTIAKSLLSSVQNVKVYFDGSQLDVAITEDADSWLLSFTYMHSTHKVMISLATNAGDITLLGIEPWVWIASAIIIGTLLTVAVAFMRRRKGFQSTRVTEQNQKSMP